MLEIKNLQKKFKNGTQALNGVSFKVKKGEFISILGPSGSGKTTLLRSINGLDSIEKGEIIFNKNKINNSSLPNIQRKTGMIFQEYNLINNLSSINNVLTGLLSSSSKFLSMFYLFTKEQKLDALKVLDTVGLLEKSYKRVDELSGGQRQRVGIARAIIKKPLLLLADEPVASLDPKSALAIMNLLKMINKVFNITVLCNLHQEELASKFSDRVIGLSGGSIVFNDEAKFLKKNIYKLYI
jgi:phosphonate transport system ATP-binding protein|tara:strand:- start:2649 stop:3368 length:720 start_codon:yes stop_codon:yes gene_type:complete